MLFEDLGVGTSGTGLPSHVDFHIQLAIYSTNEGGLFGARWILIIVVWAVSDESYDSKS